MLEKWWVERVGFTLACLLVREESSRAVRRARVVTSRALSFRRGCIVITGVFTGIRLEVMISPAKMLPQASRLRGLITAGSFSLMGEREVKRGWPIET